MPLASREERRRGSRYAVGKLLIGVVWAGFCRHIKGEGPGREGCSPPTRNIPCAIENKMKHPEQMVGTDIPRLLVFCMLFEFFFIPFEQAAEDLFFCFQNSLKSCFFYLGLISRPRRGVQSKTSITGLGGLANLRRSRKRLEKNGLPPGLF